MTTKKPKATITETQISLLEQSFETFKEDVEQQFETVERSIASLRNEIREWMRERQPHYYRYSGIAIAVVGVIWWIITAQINSISRSNEKDFAALTEIARQNSRINENQTGDIAHLAKMLASDHSERTANEREIETQFDADSQLRNIQWSAFQRRMNDFQNALADLGAKIPHVTGNPYFQPNIANRRHDQEEE
jgi:hypothetical protein